MRQKYVTTGEFARICNTTKETLFHYDEIGLLKPMYVGENRYRYYSAKQFYLYDLIETLKQAGCSLSEIKEYTMSNDPCRYLELLDRCYQRLELKRSEIEQIMRVIGNTREGVKQALDNQTDKPYLELCGEEYLIVTPVDSTDELNVVYALQDHFAYCSSRRLGDEFPTGSIFTEENLKKGWFYESYYYTRSGMPEESERLRKKPAGQYLTTYYQGDYESLPAALNRLLSYGTEQGYMLSGDGYVHELLGYFTSKKKQEYVLKISLPVRLGEG